MTTRLRPTVLVGLCLLLVGCSASTHPNAVTSAPAPTPSSTLPSATSPSVTVPSTPAATSVAPPAATTTAAPSPTSTGVAGTGQLVVLNPGHNGGDASHPAIVNQLVPAGFGQMKACETTGTETVSGYPEHAFNFDVAQRVAVILQAHGLRVQLTRPNDTGVGPCVDVRAAQGNAADVAAVVSIHADGAPSTGHGFHVNQDAKQPAGPAIDAQSRALGTAIHNALVASSGLTPSTYIGTNGYYYRTDLAGLNLATRPATFLELGNMKNPGDAALQTSVTGRAAIAGAIAAGILAYLGVR